ncbi:MAG: YdiU family protein [Crocinitomix sp.]|nr:YdiU family protein [Crocinitomix sp.]
MGKIQQLKIKDTFTKQLPADPIETNQQRQVNEACFSYVDPTDPEKPTLVHVCAEMAEVLQIENTDSEQFLSLVSGQKNFEDMRPYAMCYGGHQFGSWAGQLGDGRAINIAEVETETGNWFLQLKGAGRTPYSRGADGLAVLRSSIREYLMSEAMFHLGVPSTRALSLSLTGEEVLRDVLYNGNADYEKGAVVCRMAPSFVRFGSFEIFAARKDHVNLKRLADYTITSNYPHLGEPCKAVYLQFFEEIATRSRKMVLDWQRIGFVHGVMNTDNMSILGLTIDYGPYGWLENYDPGWTPNTTDAQNKRYRFGNQPSVVLWNLTQLANSLYPLIEDIPALEAILDNYKTQYQKEYQTMMLAKMGVYNSQVDDANLIQQLTENLRASETDMTLFFRNLAKFNEDAPLDHLAVIKTDSYLAADDFENKAFQWKAWLNEYALRLKNEPTKAADRQTKMDAVNPKYVLRNYMAHLAIEAADQGDYSVLEELYQLLKQPYANQPNMEKWFAKRPNWANEKVGCSMLSCSS